MLVIDSPLVKRQIATVWVAFFLINTYLMFDMPGRETIPYHLVWASFALLYGLAAWSLKTTYIAFIAITLATGIPLIKHARAGFIGWEECSEIVLMGVIAALLVWHVRRGQAARAGIQAMREAERASSELREIATRCGSHELRTRLAIVRGLTDLIRTNASDAASRANAVLSLEELDKASVTATNLLTLFRIEGPTAAPRDVDLDALVSGISRRWAVRADRLWRFRADAGTVSADPERLEAALDCLIENAVKFTDEDDRIDIEAIPDPTNEHRVLLSVQDSGPGIPEADIGLVTELFGISQAAGEQAGSGLGLAIVKAITESFGGKVIISSAVGQGTKVTLRLPRKGGGGSVKEQPAPARHHQVRAPERILAPEA
ncbi:MAG TPA: HAMP domain-containing sensor histidine kinase [Jatrophihabitans sp.]|nr:HAMP domain-containing sensor histidine kinase [Jatrophihabitans sp.]